MKNLLLLSSSREHDSGYLEHALDMIKDHLGDVKELLFIPFAGVSISYDQYVDMVQAPLSSLGVKVVGIHQCENAKEAVENAQAVAVGGGNTFHLLHQLYENDLIDAIQAKVNAAMPYIGWSAGSNVAGASIRTTNDMPIIEPKSFNALGLVDFQINPHYTDFNPPGHNGETREQRLAEFMVINPTTPIVAIVEGTAIKQSGDNLTLIGPSDGFVFKGGEKSVLPQNADITAYL